MVTKLVDGAVAALTVAAGAARHVIWYVSYQMDGSARDEQPAPAAEPPSR